MIRHRKGQPRRPLWGRWLAVCIALGLVVAALVYHHQQSTIQQQRVEAAAGLATGPSDPVMPTGTPSGAPSATPTPPAASQTAPAPPASAPASSAPAAPVQTLDAASASLPPTKFIWPAAGMSVTVVPMDWSPDKAVDPPLDGNGFDPTGHWLKHTGQTSDVKPKVVAGHNCYSPDRKL